MKTIRNVNWLRIPMMLSGLAVFLMSGCSQNDSVTPFSPDESYSVNGTEAPASRLSTEHLDPISYVGYTNYYTYAKKGKEVLQNSDCPATAILEYLGGQDFQLIVTENGNCGGRVSLMLGKVTPGGQIKMEFAPFIPILDIVMGHSGCTIDGPFPVYFGTLDNERLQASSFFNARCPEWPANDIFETPVDGPVYWRWSIDLSEEE